MREFLQRKYVKFWHWKFKAMNKNWQDSDMYTNGQYDEIPYQNFDWFWERLMNDLIPDADFWREHWKYILLLILEQAFVILALSWLIYFLKNL